MLGNTSYVMHHLLHQLLDMVLEFGDVLFALTNYARFIDVNPEDALERTNKRFIKRFQIMEKIIAKDGLNLSEMKLSEMDIFWEKAKKVYLSA